MHTVCSQICALTVVAQSKPISFVETMCCQCRLECRMAFLRLVESIHIAVLQISPKLSLLAATKAAARLLQILNDFSFLSAASQNAQAVLAAE